MASDGKYSCRLSGKVCVVTGTGGSLVRLDDPADCDALVQLALGTFGRLDVALFLASDQSSYVTGVDIVVDGGMKVW